MLELSHTSKNKRILKKIKGSQNTHAADSIDLPHFFFGGGGGVVFCRCCTLSLTDGDVFCFLINYFSNITNIVTRHFIKGVGIWTHLSPAATIVVWLQISGLLGAFLLSFWHQNRSSTVVKRISKPVIHTIMTSWTESSTSWDSHMVSKSCGSVVVSWWPEALTVGVSLMFCLWVMSEVLVWGEGVGGYKGCERICAFSFYKERIIFK